MFCTGFPGFSILRGPIRWCGMCFSSELPIFRLHLWSAGSRKPKAMSGEEFLLCFAAAMGVGYCLNFVGNGINFFFTFFNHKTLEEMNPVIDMATDMSPSMLIYACILGPFGESF